MDEHRLRLKPVLRRVWPLFDEPLANRAFLTLAELERVLEDRCVRLTEMSEVIQAHTCSHGWPLDRKTTKRSPGFRITSQDLVDEAEELVDVEGLG